MPFLPSNPRFWFLAPLAGLIGGISEIRDWYYRNHFLPVTRLPRSTISVGNLTVGGTGKTPVVGFLCDYLNQAQKSVAVLTRGYGRKSRLPILLQGSNLTQYQVKETGDEPCILACHLKNGVVVVDANRARGGRLALQATSPQVFLLDDGFQRRSLSRDLDIVTLDAANPWGNGYLLPLGKLREPTSQLRRADLLWITRVNQTSDDLEEIRRRIHKKIIKPMVFSAHVAQQLVSCSGQNRLPLTDLKDKKVVAFCGIANPRSFEQTLLELGARLVSFRSFADHHSFRKKELKELSALAQQLNADWLVTTEKDAVRLESSYGELGRDCYYLEIGIKILAGAENLKKMLEKLNLI